MSHTRDEILSQPETWSQALQALSSAPPNGLPSPTDYDAVVFTGCGSTHYLSLWAAREAQRLHGVTCLATPASELLSSLDAVLPRRGRLLLVAISRSGETTETLRALETFRDGGRGEALAVTCYPEKLLAQRATWAITLPMARERSVVQTRSFTSMVLAVAWWLGGGPPPDLAPKLAEAGSRMLTAWEAAAARLASTASLSRFFYLGSGPFFGLASEGMLKIKEMSLAHSEAYHFPEIRHGPMALVDEASLVVGLIGDDERPSDVRVLREMRGLGARTLALAEDGSSELSAAADIVVPLASGLPPLWRAPLYLPFLQLLAYHRALAQGRDPDHPVHLSPVVVLHE